LIWEKTIKEKEFFRVEEERKNISKVSRTIVFLTLKETNPKSQNSVVLFKNIISSLTLLSLDENSNHIF